MTTMLTEQATCQHFGVCGGCATQNSYKEELASKEARVRDLLASFEVREWRPILGSADIWHYRNKMEFAFSAPLSPPEGLGLTLGLRQAGSFSRVVDLETCYLVSAESFEILRRAR